MALVIFSNVKKAPHAVSKVLMATHGIQAHSGMMGKYSQQQNQLWPPLILQTVFSSGTVRDTTYSALTRK